MSDVEYFSFNALSTYEKNGAKCFSRTYFALCADGTLVNLGCHDNIEEADETASNLGYEVIWIVNGEDAAQWADAINSQRSDA